MLAVQSNTRFQVKPLYMQVRDALLERIKDGSWKPGASLPSEIDLYRQLGVSLGTLRKALGVLESEQLIVREPGRGTFVRDHQAPRHSVGSIRSAGRMVYRCGAGSGPGA
jgi:GntR family transcriptional regulator